MGPLGPVIDLRLYVRAAFPAILKPARSALLCITLVRAVACVLLSRFRRCGGKGEVPSGAKNGPRGQLPALHPAALSGAACSTVDYVKITEYHTMHVRYV